MCKFAADPTTEVGYTRSTIVNCRYERNPLRVSNHVDLHALAELQRSLPNAAAPSDWLVLSGRLPIGSFARDADTPTHIDGLTVRFRSEWPH